jgi:hypothetical protein
LVSLCVTQVPHPLARPAPLRAEELRERRLTRLVGADRRDQRRLVEGRHQRHAVDERRRPNGDGDVAEHVAVRDAGPAQRLGQVREPADGRPDATAVLERGAEGVRRSDHGAIHSCASSS